MLAFVSWHWPRAGVDPVHYVDALANFQQVLLANAPAGLRGATCFRSGPAPWLSAPAESYEDWYVVEGSEVLDPLNLAAVNPACREAHDAIARLAGGALGGLYRLRQGGGILSPIRTSFWFSKPAGMTYAELDSLMRPLVVEPAVGLWGRQMGLGPAPEFCLLAPDAMRLPAQLSGCTRPLELLYG